MSLRGAAAPPWTPEDIGTLMRLRAEGMRGNDIAVALGRTHGAVAQATWRYREAGVNVPTVRRGRPRKARVARTMRWTEAEATVAVDLREAGMGDLAIAAALDRTRDQVTAFFARRRRAGMADRRHQTWLRWTPEAEALAVAMYRAGNGPEEVARATGHTIAAVWSQVHRLRERGVDLPDQRGWNMLGLAGRT